MWHVTCVCSVQFSRSVVSDSLRPHESQHTRPPCPSPTPGVHSNSRPSSRWCHPAISSSVVPFSSCPQSLPASECVCSVTSNSFWPPRTVAHQAPLPMEFSRIQNFPRILERVAISYSRGSSWSRNLSHISCTSCIGRRVLYHCAT